MAQAKNRTPLWRDVLNLAAPQTWAGSMAPATPDEIMASGRSRPMMEVAPIAALTLPIPLRTITQEVLPMVTA